MLEYLVELSVRLLDGPVRVDRSDDLDGVNDPDRFGSRCQWAVHQPVSYLQQVTSH